MTRALVVLSLMLLSMPAALAATPAAPAAPAAAPSAPAAEAPVKSEPADAAEKTTHEAVLAFVNANSLVAGVGLLLAGVLPLFYGWRLIRGLYFVMGAVIGGGLVFAFTASTSLPTFLVVLLAINAGLLWGFVMSYLYHVQVALSGGLFVAALFAAPGVARGNPMMGAGMAVLGLAIGIILGWCLAPLLGILQTALFGAVLMGTGAYVLLMNVSPDAGLLVGGLVALIGLVAGIVYQIRSGGRSPKAKAGARPRRTGARRVTRPRLAPSAGKSGAAGATGATGVAGADTEVPR